MILYLISVLPITLSKKIISSKKKKKIKQDHNIIFIIYRAKLYYNKLKDNILKYLDTHFL